MRRVLSILLAAAVVLRWSSQEAPATVGTVAAYAFSEGTGTSTVDGSGHGNGATLTGGTEWIAAGRFGHALGFDGVDDAAIVADARSLDLTGTITLEAWIHPTAAVPSGTVISKAGASGDPYALGLSATGIPYVTVTTSAGTTTFAGDEPILPNQWTHLAAAYTGGSLRLFVNGIKEWSTPLSGAMVSSTGLLTIGGSTTGGFFEGRIDEVRLDAFALDAGHVRDDMALPVDPATPLTVGTHTPASGARGALVTPISARFTRSLDPGTVTSATFQLRHGSTIVSANLAYDSSTRTVTLTPTTPLAPLTDYSVTVFDGPAGVKDAGGAELAATVVWSFQTGSDPTSVRLAYGFGEGAGTAAEDASGNGNSGTLMNGPTWTGDGKYGRALVFDGVNDTVRVSDADTQDATTALTLEAWIYPTTAATSAKVLFKQNYAPDHSYLLGLAAGAPYVRIRTSTGAYPLVGPAAISANTWTHIAATYDGATLRVFVNGLEAANRAAAGELYLSHKPLWVGSAFNADYFSGRIDDVRLYVRALTPAEIVEDMATSVEDVTGPTVTSTTPIADAVDVPAGTSVTATFNEPLAAGSVSWSTFELRDALGTHVPATVSYDAPSRTVSLDPGHTLNAGGVYTATLTGGTAGPRITDMAGNPLAAGYSWSFTTSTAPGAPTVVSVSLFPRSMSLSIGGSHQFTATAHHSDGTWSNVTTSATWQSSSIAIVSANASGRAAAEGAGNAVVSATFGGHSADAPVTVYEGEAIPPDPADVATLIDPTASTLLSESTRFLYTGENPIQRGVVPGVIDARRAAVIRGILTTRDGQPLSGARVTIGGHPELGHTVTRLDGGYDLAVNGGGPLIVRFDKTGFLPADRIVEVPWSDVVALPDAALVPLDAEVTTIDLTAPTPVQVARGSVVTDADGTRRATVLFPQGTTASLVMPDGTTQPLTTLHVRATEYTVGPNGEQAMPAPLPPTSAYTYAVELSVDEALAAGAASVTFSTPVPVYVENFIGFPVGEIVPSGFYDRALGRWLASANGLTVGVVSIAGDIAELDLDGDEHADSAAALEALGITVAERQQLASLYQPGQTLWRVPVAHFTPCDFNWPPGLNPNAGPPNVGPARTKQPTTDPRLGCGSIIECQNQVLGESLTVTGSPLTLHYRSDRVAGRVASRMVTVPLSGASLSASVRRIDVELRVAGQRIVQSFPALANQSATLQWDGRDAYGRRIEGADARVSVSHVYDFEQQYAFPFAIGAFGRGGQSRALDIGRSGREYRVSQGSSLRLGAPLPGATPIGGWSFDVHHQFDPGSRTLLLGTGTRRNATSVSRLLRTAVGGGEAPVETAEGPLDVALSSPSSVAVGPDGTLYVADQLEGVLDVTPAGTLTRVVTLEWDRKPALAIGRDGALHYSVGETDGSTAPGTCLEGGRFNRLRIHRLSDEGLDTIVDTIEISGTLPLCGNGTRLAATSDGAFYVAAGEHLYRVVPGDEPERLVLPEGFVITALAADRDGGLLLSDGPSITRRSPGGAVTQVAGNETFESSGDGGPAAQAGLGQVRSMAVSADGSLLIVERVPEGRIRQISTDGIIATIAGGAFNNLSPIVEGAPALGADLLADGIARGPDGALYATEIGHARVFRLDALFGAASDTTIRIPSEDGQQLYEFDPRGRHLRTRHALTGATLYTFTYTGSGQLIAVVDGNGLETRIERTGPHARAIVAPFGQRTTVQTDANGYLSRLTRPDERLTQLAYTDGGLLTQLVDPNGQAHTFTYDARGLLIRDADPAGGAQTLAEADIPNGSLVTRASEMDRVRTYELTQLPAGGELQRNIEPDGTVSTQQTRLDGTIERIAADGTRTISASSPDPRFGMQAAVGGSVTVTTPAGLTFSTSTTRTAVLADPTNAFSLQTQTDTTVVNGRTYRTVFDAPTRTFTSTTPAGRVSTSTIDTLGRVTRMQTGTLTPVDFTYDSQGRLATMTQGARQSAIAYDVAGRPSTLTDALARTVAFAYDAADRVTTQTLPDLRAIQFGYDDAGNLTTLMPPGRPAHAFTHTPVDLTASYTPPPVPGAGATTYGFNVDRQPTTIVRPDAQTTSFTYGLANGRLNTVTFSRGQLQYGYDTAGRVTTLNDPGGVNLAFTYDAALPLSETWSGGLTGSISRTFTTNFEIATESVNGTHQVSFGYDADRLLTQAGALTIARHPQNGLVAATTLGATTEAFEYNAFGELSRQTASVNGTPVFDVQYTRDALGRITQRTEVVDGITRVWEYGYDLAGRLQSVRRNSTLVAFYAYDANGNRTQANTEAGEVHATYDDQDRLLTYGNTTYTYTANGELATKTVAGQTTTYEYDTVGNLIRVVLPNADVITYTVDGRGRRVAKALNGPRMKGWLYADQLRPVAELDASGAVVSRFVYGTRMNVPEYVIKNGVTYRVFSDHLGSPRIVLDATTGEVVQRLDFTAFGELIQDSNPGWQPFGFAGALHDEDTGLLRFGARDYEALTARWMAKEPLGFFRNGPSNFYAYVLGDPINRIDVNGLWSISASLYTPGGGGGITFGRSPETGLFLTFDYGVGFGGGVSYDPDGRPPGAKPGQPPCGVVTVSIGGFIGASATFGFGTLGVGAEAGARSSPGVIDGYRGISRPNATVGMPPPKGPAGLSASAAAGLRVSIQ